MSNRDIYNNLGNANNFRIANTPSPNLNPLDKLELWRSIHFAIHTGLRGKNVPFNEQTLKFAYKRAMYAENSQTINLYDRISSLAVGKPPCPQFVIDYVFYQNGL